MESEMSPKRPIHGDGDDGLGDSVQETKRRLTLTDNIEGTTTEGNSSDEILLTKSVRQVEEVVERVEKVVERVGMGLDCVRKEVERVEKEVERVGMEVERVAQALGLPTSRLSVNKAETSERRGLQLVFVNKLPSHIFADCIIKAEDHGPVKIELVDTDTKTVVKTGHYSSIKIKIVVLDGDFCSDDHQDWSENEFRDKVVREREGKRPLLTGELNATLTVGVGVLGDMVFTDNSSWMRCGKFRLGATVLRGSNDDLRIKEGRSEAFVVKDHRGKLNEKHYPPTLDDEIWRLKKIAKGGIYHVRLTNNGVHTVRDFLQLYTANPTSLRTILECQAKTWDAIVEHATTCVVNDKQHYAYNKNTGESLVENQKKHAYKNVEDFVPVDAPTILGPSRPLTDLQAGSLGTSICLLQNPEVPVSQPETQLALSRASASTSYAIYEGGNQFHLSSAQNTPPIQACNPALKNGFTMDEIFYAPYNEENGWFASGLQGQVDSTNNLATDQMSAWSPVDGIWGQGNSFFFSASNESELGIVSSVPDFSVNISRTGQRNAAARCKIRAVIMCILFKRNLARRKARPFYLNHY